MEYRKIINLLNNTSNQLSKFRKKKWIKLNDQSRGVYNTNIDKNTMVRSSSWYYSDVYILVKGRITSTVDGADDAAQQADERNKGVIFKSFALFINFKSEINNTEIDNAKNIGIVIPMYNLIEYSDNYPKTSAGLWQYHKDESNDNLTVSESFKSKIKTTGNTPANGKTKDVELIVLLKYISNFWRTLEIPLINCEFNLILT